MQIQILMPLLYPVQYRECMKTACAIKELQQGLYKLHTQPMLTDLRRHMHDMASLGHNELKEI